ncbi:MAG: branched-chain amino acid ABC transporter permease [Halobacteriales archaeon]|nr:branched-chain amino acid ABC transporter permease [Halobacteriales archaeon]
MDDDTAHPEHTGLTLNPLELPPRHQAGLLGLVALAAVPLAASIEAIGFVTDLTILQVTGALFFAVYVMTWDVVSGYTGEISFGHALFIGVGAYTSGLLNVVLDVPLFASIPAAVLAASLAGLLIGFPSLRVKGPYFSLITLVAPVILLRAFVFFSDITGGETGLFGIETISLDPTTNYYIAFALFVFALAVFLAITRSDAGQILTAIREDEATVVSVGLNPAKFKLFAFVLSGAIGGLAGALFIHTFAQGVATPSETLGLVLSIELIVATILGGIGTITGAAIGGLFFYLVRTWLRGVDATIPLVSTPVSELYFLIFGLVTLAFLFFLPRGLVPRTLLEARRLRARYAGDARPDGGQPPLGAVIARFRRAIKAWFGGDRR